MVITAVSPINYNRRFVRGLILTRYYCLYTRSPFSPISILQTYFVEGSESARDRGNTITEYNFAESFHLLTYDDFNVKWKDTILHIMHSLPADYHFPRFPNFVKALPNSLHPIVAVEFSQFIKYKDVT